MDFRFGPFERALAERYQFEQELGRGAMGTVYRAKDLRLGRPVAIKMLHPALTNELGVGRFESEVRLAARLHHQNIIAVHESGEIEGRLFYVMDYLGGEPLRDRLKREKQLSVEDAIRITEQVAAGLQHAHDQGVVHRDIKPENIILADGQARIVDFGIALALDSVDEKRLTATGLSVGTPHYISPEQAAAERDVGPQADQYALACMLFEMLAGEPPFTGPATSVIRRHIGETPPRLRTRREKTPTAVDAAVARALEKVPTDRFASAGDFGRALHASSVEEPPPPVKKWFAIAAGVVLMVFAGSVMRSNATVADSVDDTVRWLTRTGIDSARYAVLPFDGSPADADIYSERLRAALGEWEGISIVADADLEKASDQLRADGKAPDARAWARAAAAGRYVTGSVTSMNGVRIVRAELRDARAPLGGRPAIATFSVTAAEDSALRKLAFALLFGPQHLGSMSAATGTRSRAAFQSFLGGQAALRRWRLPAADSGFRVALAADADFPHAALALAQLSEWMRDDASEASELLARALSRSARLGVDESAHAEALRAIHAGRYHDACVTYRSLIARDSSDFGAWFGLSECQRRDSIVVPDPRSPTGRSFRGSAHAASTAMSRAFASLSSIDTCCIARANALRRRTLTISTTHLRRGVGLSPDETRYSAYPEWRGDSIAHVPLPNIGDIRRPTRSHALAVERQRQAFYALTVRRVALTPRNADALEEMAEAMELLNEAGTIDTLLQARRYASNGSQRLRIAIREVWLRVKFALPDKPRELVEGRVLAESLVKNGVVTTPADARNLAGVAAFLGNGAAAAALARRGASANRAEGFSSEVVQSAAAYLAFASVGGPTDSLARSEERLITAIENDVVQDRQQSAFDMLIGQAAGLAYPSYRSPMMDRLDSADYLLAAERAYSRKDTLGVLRILRGVDGARAGMRTADITLDALYPEAWLLAGLGDPAGALRRLSGTLNAIRSIPTASLFEVANAGAFPRAVALRADLMERTMHPDAARWRRAARALMGE